MNVFVIKDEWQNDLDYENHEQGDDFIAVCATKEAAIDYLRNYEQVINKKFDALVKSTGWDKPEYCDFTFYEKAEKVYYNDNCYGIAEHCLYIEEHELIGGESL